MLTNQVLTRIRAFLLGAIVLLIVLAIGLISRYLVDFPTVQAALVVSSGSVHVSHAAGGASFDAKPGDVNLKVGAGDTLEAMGWATLHFATDVESDLFPGSKLRIDRLNGQDADVQLDMTLLSGQLVNRTGSQTDRRAHDVVTLAPDSTVTANNAEYAATVHADRVMLGTLAGRVLFKVSDKTVDVPTGSGVSLSKDQPVPQPTAWGSLRVSTYRADGTVIALPIIVISPNNDQFTFSSARVFLIPPDTYGLSVDTLAPYKVSALTVAASKLTELPITFGEIKFSLIGGSGNSVKTPALSISSDSRSDMLAPDAPLLVSPGIVALNVATSDAPDKTQPTGQIAVLPGQRITITLRSDLFGSGSVQITVANPDGSAQTAANAAIYKDGADESGSPLLNVKSDGTSQPLPLGNYVAIVLPTSDSIATRIPFQINKGQVTPVNVLLGSLTVTFTDSKGKPVSKLVYIRAASQMTANLSLDQMRAKPYGIAVYSGRTLALPVGDYVVHVDDFSHPPAQTATVTAGQNTMIIVSPVSPSTATP